MKKLVLSIIFVFSLLCSYSTAFAYTTYPAHVEINVDGKFIQTDAHPYIKEERLLIPIRTLSSLGLSYRWDTSSKSATIQNKDEDLLIIKENSQEAYKNNNKIIMDVPAQVKNGRVFVPVRFVTETLGYHVQYESIRKMVFITSKDYKFNTNALNQDDLVAARRAAISLPLTTDFKPLGYEVGALHAYTFLAGDVKKYIFFDGLTGTIVKIQDGKAIVQGQFESGIRGSFADIAGKMTKKNVTDPLLKPYYLSENPIVSFSKNWDGTMTINYTPNGNGYNTKRVTTPFSGVYSNIIQEVPWQVDNGKSK